MKIFREIHHYIVLTVLCNDSPFFPRLVAKIIRYRVRTQRVRVCVRGHIHIRINTYLVLTHYLYITFVVYIRCTH